MELLPLPYPCSCEPVCQLPAASSLPEASQRPRRPAGTQTINTPSSQPSPESEGCLVYSRATRHFISQGGVNTPPWDHSLPTTSHFPVESTSNCLYWELASWHPFGGCLTLLSCFLWLPYLFSGETPSAAREPLPRGT